MAFYEMSIIYEIVLIMYLLKCPIRSAGHRGQSAVPHVLAAAQGTMAAAQGLLS